VQEIGSVKRLSIAVLVDGTYTNGEDGKREYKPRGKEELDQLGKLARSAVGYDAKRGDTLDIINMQFVNALNRDFNTVEPLFGFSKSDYFRIAEIFVLAAVGILVILLVIRPLVARTLEALPSALAGGNDQNLLADQSADSLALASPAETGTALMPGEEDENDLIDVAQVAGKVRASALKQIEEIVERHPEQTIGIIRQWMNEEN
jgi:flagellar M-ring protein FliF